jgi:hypothetical protein
MSYSSLASIKCAYDVLENGDTVPVSRIIISVKTQLEHFFIDPKTCT